MNKFRIVIRIDNMGPEGQPLAPNYRTVDIESDALAKALTCGTYSHAGVIGVETLPSAHTLAKTVGDQQ